MLEKVWRKGKLLTLLVGMYIGMATMKNTSILKTELPYDSAVSFLNMYPEKTRI